MADWYVAKAADGGNDSNNGTSLGTPKLTIQAALNAAAGDDNIFIRRGIYTGQWAPDKVCGRTIRAYQGEDVTIDLEGIYDRVTSNYLAGNTSTATKGLQLVDLKFVNYTGCAFETGNGPGGSPVSFILNCFFKAANAVASCAYGANFASMGDLTIDGCTFVGHTGAISTASLTALVNCAFKGNTADLQSVFATTMDYNAYPGNTETNGINSTTSPFSFNNEGTGDYSLPSNSALRRRGQFGRDIGASFNPRVMVDAANAWNLLSAGVNDEDYYDTTNDEPGPDGPADAGPAIYTGGIWKLDNVAEPGAKSCRVKFGPFTLPGGSKVTLVEWSGLEDETQASGSKEIFGHLANKRNIEVSINGGALTAYDKDDLINANASTVTLYVTIRVDGTTVS